MRKKIFLSFLSMLLGYMIGIVFDIFYFSQLSNDFDHSWEGRMVKNILETAPIEAFFIFVWGVVLVLHCFGPSWGRVTGGIAITDIIVAESVPTLGNSVQLSINGV